MNPLEGRVSRWREEAADYERDGALVPAADLLRRVAEEAEAALRDWRHEELTVAEAAEESGYSERRLRELLSEGTLPNAGRSGAPRIRRRDLPSKPGGDGPVLEVTDEGGASLADEALRRRL